MTRETTKAWKLKNKEQVAHTRQAYYRNKHQPIVDLLGGKCFVCETSPPRLELHHLSYPNGKPTSAWAAYKEAAKEPENFRLLCHPCHSRVTVATRTEGMMDRFAFCVEKFTAKRAIPEREKRE